MKKKSNVIFSPVEIGLNHLLFDTQDLMSRFCALCFCVVMILMRIELVPAQLASLLT